MKRRSFLVYSSISLLSLPTLFIKSEQEKEDLQINKMTLATRNGGFVEFDISKVRKKIENYTVVMSGKSGQGQTPLIIKMLNNQAS